MDKLSNAEYFKLSIKHNLHLKLRWVLSVFGIVVSGNDLVRVEGNKHIVSVNEETYELSGTNINQPIFRYSDIVKVESKFLSIIKSDIETTRGRLLMNAIIIEYGLSGKIPYINNSFTFSDIQEKILPMLVEDENYIDDDNHISLTQYKRATTANTYVRQFTPVTVVSATEKTITPPPGVIAYKHKLIKEYKSKYGDDVLSDVVKVIEIEDKLKAYDYEYMKDDPTVGIITSSKALNTARKKKYLTIGTEMGISDKSNVSTIETSLLEGIPKDPVVIGKVFNALRAGSYSRGLETQVSGVIAKYLSRGTHSFKITEENCKVTYGLTIDVNKDNHAALVGCYQIINKKDIRITTTSVLKLVGTTIELRSVLYCKAKGDRYCKICAGDTMSRNENSPGLVAIRMGGKAIEASLAKFHVKNLSVHNVTLDELLGL